MRDNCHMLLAPAGTPAPIIQTLYAAMAQVLKEPEVVARLNKLGRSRRGLFLGLGGLVVILAGAAGAVQQGYLPNPVTLLHPKATATPVVVHTTPAPTATQVAAATTAAPTSTPTEVVAPTTAAPTATPEKTAVVAATTAAPTATPTQVAIATQPPPTARRPSSPGGRPS